MSDRHCRSNIGWLEHGGCSVFAPAVRSSLFGVRFALFAPSLREAAVSARAALRWEATRASACARARGTRLAAPSGAAAQRALVTACQGSRAAPLAPRSKKGAIPLTTYLRTYKARGAGVMGAMGARRRLLGFRSPAWPSHRAAGPDAGGAGRGLCGRQGERGRAQGHAL